MDGPSSRRGLHPMAEPRTDLRAPAVAGRFYPGEAEELAATSSHGCTRRAHAPPSPRLLAPHAGYVYSGDVAARGLRRHDRPAAGGRARAQPHRRRPRAARSGHKARSRCPAATSPSTKSSAMRRSRWSRPRRAPPRARARGGAAVLARPPRPTCVITPHHPRRPEDASASRSASAGQVVTPLDDRVLVVASSDMSHYLARRVTRRIDPRALEPLLALDPQGLYRRVRDEDITMCGILPATAMLAYARPRRHRGRAACLRDLRRRLRRHQPRGRLRRRRRRLINTLR